MIVNVKRRILGAALGSLLLAACSTTAPESRTAAPAAEPACRTAALGVETTFRRGRCGGSTACPRTPGARSSSR